MSACACAQSSDSQARSLAAFGLVHAPSSTSRVAHACPPRSAPTSRSSSSATSATTTGKPPRVPARADPQGRRPERQRAQYGAAECSFEKLEGQLGVAALGGRVRIDRRRVAEVRLPVATASPPIAIEMPHGLRLVRAADIAAGGRMELVSPHVSFSELRVDIQGPFGRSTPRDARAGRAEIADAPAGEAALPRQPDRPDLPHDQGPARSAGARRAHARSAAARSDPGRQPRLPRARRQPRLARGRVPRHQARRAICSRSRWKVPIFGSSHDLITWQLDKDAVGARRVRSRAGALAHRLPIDRRSRPAQEGVEEDGGVLRSLKVDGIDIALSLIAPRNLEVGQGLDRVRRRRHARHGRLQGLRRDRQPRRRAGCAVRSAASTRRSRICKLGPAEITCDRLHFDGLDQLEVTFDGFRPTKISMVIHRVTATNLAIKLG